MNNHLDIVKYLCKDKNINIDEIDLDGNNASFYACKKGYKDIINFLISKDSNINLTNYFGENCLIIACKNNHIDIVELLLLKNAKT